MLGLREGPSWLGDCSPRKELNSPAFTAQRIRAAAVMHGDKSLQKTEKAVRVFRPALLPDNRSLVWYPLAICGVLSALGYALGSFPLAIIPLLAVAVFPGLPIAIHSLYFISVRITVCGDTLNVVDWAGDPFVRYPRRQEIALSRVAYVYRLQREAEAHKLETAPSAPFCNTRILSEKYRTANADPRRTGTLARTNSGLVLSDSNGENKIYIMHFHDLSREDWQNLARQFLKKNKTISFLMTEREKKGLLGLSA